MVAPPSSRIQQRLQSAVQSVRWTYSLFWQLCPQQGRVLVWGEGHYNGAIKTRKTVQPMEAAEVSAEEASLHRSQQLRELYDSLSAGDQAGHPPARRPCASLSPEDLTESEWFYLMCVSFSFPPGAGVLVWGEGHYNGAIKTRKTVQPMEASAEEASGLDRSQQLRELYDSLSAGEAGQLARRPCASLSPEDLTESEWFYLTCVSFSFLPGAGLPGKAFAEQRHVWLTRANEADSKIFSRAILAKSARIQTVVCIPLTDGILELGTTEKVEENMGLIQHAKSFFTDQLDQQSKPALSENSTSSPVACTEQSLFHCQSVDTVQTMRAEPHVSNQEEDDDDVGDDDDDDDDDDVEEDNGDNDDDDDEVEACTDLEAEPGGYGAGIPSQPIQPGLTVAEAAIPAAEPSEFMQLEMSEGIRLGSPDDCSNNLDSEWQALVNQSDHQHGDNSYQAWHFLHEDLGNGIPQSSGSTQIQDLTPEDVHYSETVSAILQINSDRWIYSSSTGYLAHSQQSAFSEWSYGDHDLPAPSNRTSQWVLKNVLFSIPRLNVKYKDDSSPQSRDGEGGSRFRKGIQLEELSANHVLAERRRREKLNERFIILRSLVPFVTKMDKASILGDTIEYVKQLRRHIQDLEAQNRQLENQRPKAAEAHGPGVHDHAISSRNRVALPDKRKLRVLDGGKGIGKPTKLVGAPSTNVEVSIIETDALVELQCPYRDGLLLKIMQALHELRLEIASMQSSSSNGSFVAEIRAKVKGIRGKKASIVEVKKAIHQIFSRYSF